jgi:hypothetical protein
MSVYSRSKNRFTLAAAILGVLVPLLCCVFIREFDTLAGIGTLILWPSSIMLLPVTTRAEGVKVLTISILVNVILYAVIGRLLAPMLLRGGLCKK